ncbi:hypothetical protein AAKU61_001205 [Undibacterium sp. GrIS 1.2]|uniref:hypothetical protein n=1 Tax=Undibacterium sp. GrIS 1.2 TaxID=3143933 RepID=UPI00339AA890
MKIRNYVMVAILFCILGGVIFGIAGQKAERGIRLKIDPITKFMFSPEINYFSTKAYISTNEVLSFLQFFALNLDLYY